MNQTIWVTIGHQYGRVIYKPANEIAKLFADVAGTQTVTPNTIALLKAAGYTIKVDQPEVTI